MHISGLIQCLPYLPQIAQKVEYAGNILNFNWELIDYSEQETDIPHSGALFSTFWNPAQSNKCMHINELLPRQWKWKRCD